VNSHQLWTGYLQSNFSDSLEPHQKGIQRSVSPCFQSAQSAFHCTVSPTFAFKLNSEFPTHLSRALVTFVSLSKATVQSNYPPAAVPFQVSRVAGEEWCYIVAPLRPKPELRRSHLRSAALATQQQQAIVKLHGDFISHWEYAACSPRSEFTKHQVGTVGESLRPSCKSPIKRRGITLPKEDQSYPRSLLALSPVETGFRVLAVSRRHPLY